MADDDEPPIPPMLQEDSEATLYKYRDFSAVPEDPDHEAVPPQANRSLESSIRVQKFPVKLYAILGQKDFSDIIIWMPHGRSWKVLKPNLFESLVMPLFFEYSNYHSFNRLVNAWSFRRISSGPDRGSYYHEVRKHCHRGIFKTIVKYIKLTRTKNYCSFFFEGNPICKNTCADCPRLIRSSL